MPLKSLHQPASLALAASLFLSAAPGRAQTTPTPAAGEPTVTLDVFTVQAARDSGYQIQQSNSGTRFAIDQKNNPFTVDVLGEAFLQDLKPTNFVDAIYYTTGMQALSFFTDDTPFIISRGFQNSVYLRDGVRHTSAVDMAGFERMEAVKGPSSVLFGLTAPGGMVNFVSKKPLANRHTTVRQVFGSWNTIDTLVDTGGPLNDDKSIRYRLPLHYYNSDRDRQYAHSERIYAAPVVSWNIFPQTRLELSGEFLKVNETPLGNTPIFSDAGVLDPNRAPGTFTVLPASDRLIGDGFVQVPDDFSVMGPYNFFHDRVSAVNVKVEHTFNSTFQLRSVSAFFKRNWETFLPNRGRAALSWALPGTAFWPRDHLNNTLADSNFQENLDLVGRFATLGGTLTAIAGYEMRDEFNTLVSKATSAGLGNAAPSWDILNPATWNRLDTPYSALKPSGSQATRFKSNSYSLMTQLETLDSRLFVIAGVRKDETKSTFTNRFVASPTPVTKEPGKTTYQVGAMYRVTKSLGIYGNTSTSFLPYGSNTLAKRQDQSPYYPDPTSGRGSEVGLKHELLDGKFQHSLAFYQIRQSNIIANQVGPDPTDNSKQISWQTQSGLQRSRGVEYSFNAAPTSAYTVFGGYAYNDAIVESDSGNPTQVGRTLPSMYRHKVDIYNRYTFQLAGKSSFYVGAGYVWLSGAPFSLADTQYEFVVNKTHLVNLLLGYNFEVGKYQWNAAVNVDNALDKRWFPGSQKAERRNIRASLEVKF